MIPKSIENNVRTPLKATRIRFLVGLLVFLFILGFFLFSTDVFAIPPFEETFNTYDDGNLAGQGNWVSSTYPPPYDWFVSGVNVFEGTKAISCPNDLCGDKRVGVFPTEQGIWSLKFYLAEGECEADFDYFGIWLGSDSDLNWFRIQDLGEGCKLYTRAYEGEVELGIPFYNQWLSTEIEWNLTGDYLTSKYRVRYLGIWSNWLRSFHAVSLPEDLDAMILTADTRPTNVKPVLIDFIVEPPLPTECSSENCDLCYTETECFLADCHWNDLTEICEQPPFGVCGSGNYLRFCETQSECEALGGYWRADFCWKEAPPTIPDWENYYLLHSRFDTPTSLITNMVGFTEPIMERAGGWLVSLEGIFDTGEALARGEQFGEAIPTARGYLAIINNFFGGFPISEAFMFFLVITLAIGVFRIIRNIISLIKPI